MYNGTKVLDVHGHVSVPPASNAYVSGLLASNSLTRSPLVTGRGGVVSEEEYRAAAARHVAYMDEREIDVQLIGPRPFMMLGWMADHLLPLWTQHVNNSIAQQVKFYPGRFLGAAQLPQIAKAPDISHCLPELERCVNELGMVSVYASPDPAGDRSTPGMHEAYWYPLYERCQELGLPIIVHGTNCTDRRISIIPQNYQVGFLFEQFLATQLLSHGDVFERFPELKVVVCHAGGALNRFIKSDTHLSQRDLSNNLYFDTCAHDVDFLTAAIKQRTVAQMVFGTEAPGSGAAVRQPGEGPGKTGDDLVPVIATFDWLTEDEKIDIFNRNPAKVLPALARA